MEVIVKLAGNHSKAHQEQFSALTGWKMLDRGRTVLSLSKGLEKLVDITVM